MNNKYVKWIYVFIWAAVIFMFSSQNGSASDNNNKFILFILNILGIDMNSLFGDMSSFIIRKAAHFTEYFILYYLLFNALSQSLNRRRSLIKALIITFLYACSDEFHQIFVKDRGPSIRDVMIDTSGGMMGFLLKIFFNKYKGQHLAGKGL